MGVASELKFTRKGSCLQRRGVTLVIAGALAAQLFCAGDAAGDSAIWTSQLSGTQNRLNDVACPTTAQCVAVGDQNTILTTSNGGLQWSALNSGLPAGDRITGISCPTSTRCYAVAGDAVDHGGIVLTTADGGQTWTSQNTAPNAQVYRISCPATTDCKADGDYAILEGTTDGTHWYGESEPVDSSGPLESISCPTATNCWAVGGFGWEGPGGGREYIIATTNGGQTWTTQLNGGLITAGTLFGVSCPTTSECVTVGSDQNGNGEVLRTTDGGATWTQEAAPAFSKQLYDVSCPTTAQCWAVGGDIGLTGGAAIIATKDGGWSWTAENSDISSQAPLILQGVSCPTATQCWTVGEAGTILTLNLLPTGP